MANGQNVDLLTFDFDEDKYKDIVGEAFPQEVVIHSLGKRMEVKPPFTIYKRHRTFVKLLKKYKNKIEYDYLFSTQSSSPFEPVFLNKGKKNIAYVHFPEIHYDYSRGKLKRKLYLWLFKRWVEQGIGKLDLVFCNSNYTKEAIMRYWGTHCSKEPIVTYPPVDLSKFWCNKPFLDRKKRIVYVARFIAAKRHEIMKRLASDLPNYEFLSVGGLIDAEKNWFDKLKEKMPPNYSVKANLPGPELRKILHDSRIYAHLMEGEHFGIAPIEGLASGCVTIVHDSGGMREFIPEDYRWRTYEDLKSKIVTAMESTRTSPDWNSDRPQLWKKISVLTPETFQEQIWSNIKTILVNP